MEAAEPADLLERAFFVMSVSPDEVTVDNLSKQRCRCESDLPLPCWIMPFADSSEQHPRFPASLIRINYSKLTDSKFSLPLIARTVSQNELHFPSSVDLHPEAAD